MSNEPRPQPYMDRDGPNDGKRTGTLAPRPRPVYRDIKVKRSSRLWLWLLLGAFAFAYWYFMM